MPDIQKPDANPIVAAVSEPRGSGSRPPQVPTASSASSFGFEPTVDRVVTCGIFSTVVAICGIIDTLYKPAERLKNGQRRLGDE